MADYIEICGGTPLRGTVPISGAKNAALPMLISSLLTSEPCEYENVPNLQDVHLTLHLLEHFGAQFEFRGSTVKVHVPQLVATEASFSLVKALRASFWVLAPILARGGAARVALPGGDIIGARPVDIHLEALTSMGADIRLKHGVVFATAVNGLRPAELQFRFPSVGATHQVLMAASLTPGTTVIRGAAQEPEIVALANALIDMGADIEGAGTDVIAIRGREGLEGARVRLIGDRIEAATYLMAGIITSGDVRAYGIEPHLLGEFLQVMSDLGVDVSAKENEVSVRRTQPLLPLHVRTNPFPKLATDLQAPLMAVLAVVEGESSIEETVFEGRFSHVAELCRMGADITVRDSVATIRGVDSLIAAPVEAMDIRAGAALVLAALAAEGTSEIHEVHHLRRGYASLETKLANLGAEIRHRVSDPEDYIFAGC